MSVKVLSKLTTGIFMITVLFFRNKINLKVFIAFIDLLYSTPRNDNVYKAIKFADGGGRLDDLIHKHHVNDDAKVTVLRLSLRVK